LFALLGAFVNFALGGAIVFVVRTRRTATTARSNRGKKIFLEVFVGKHFVEVLSMLIKGLLAFAAAFIIQDSKIFGVTIDRDSLFGFASLGFMFGFWPVERVWKMFGELGGKSGQSETANSPEDNLGKPA
jgi:hypothetical protein